MLRVRRSQVRGSRILFDPSEGWKPQKVGVRTGNLPLRSQFRATQPEMWCVLSYGPQTRTHGAAPRAIQGQNWVFRVHGRAHVAKKTVLFIIGMVRKPIHGVQTCLQHMHICENWPFLGPVGWAAGRLAPPACFWGEGKESSKTATPVK